MLSNGLGASLSFRHSSFPMRARSQAERCSLPSYDARCVPCCRDRWCLPLSSSWMRFRSMRTANSTATSSTRCLNSRETGEEPRTDTELMLARLWKDIFQLEDIGRREDFFDLGGDSLLASVVAARLQGEFGVELDLGMFMSNPTLETLAALVDRLRQDKAVVAAPAAPRLAKGRCRYRSPSSSIGNRPDGRRQRRSTHSVDGTGSPAGCSTDVLLDCLQALHRRHEMLRTTFSDSERPTGADRQRRRARWRCSSSISPTIRTR